MAYPFWFPDEIFVLGNDNIYALPLLWGESGRHILPDEIASASAKIVVAEAPSLSWTGQVSIGVSNTGGAVLIVKFPKEVDYTGLSAGNVLYLQAEITLNSGDKFNFPIPPLRLVVKSPI